MLIEYLQQALRHAKYELMENGRFYGHIPELPGTWGEVDPLPIIDGIDPNPQPAYAQAD